MPENLMYFPTQFPFDMARAPWSPLAVRPYREILTTEAEASSAKQADDCSLQTALS